jgi:predicted dehydrogenase
MTIDRRTFLNTTVVGAVAVPAIARSAFAVGNDRLGLGVVGCGGRGTGAAFNAISASPDIDIVAIGDLYADRLNSSRSHMGTLNERMKVTDDDCYTGWNAYQQVMARPDVDVVILATPPHFRPEHFRHAIASGKTRLHGEASGG